MKPSNYQRIKRVMNFYYNRGVNSERVNNIYRIIIKQKKFVDRFCGGDRKNVIDMYDTIEKIDTSEWAPKNFKKL